MYEILLIFTIALNIAVAFLNWRSARKWARFVFVYHQMGTIMDDLLTKNAELRQQLAYHEEPPERG
jgi:hypothetical protein